jgi:Toprim domain-containing protein
MKYQRSAKGNVLFRTVCSNRGITGASALAFKLGIVATPMPGHEKYAGWLSIPYLSTTGVIKIRFRCLEDHEHHKSHHGKYADLPGASPWLYNAAATLETGETIAICEGELDAVTVAQQGLPAVAFPGASTWEKNSHWARLFGGWDHVLVIADGDDAGRKAATIVSDTIQQARVVNMPDGHDSSSLLVDDPDMWRKLVGL